MPALPGIYRNDEGTSSFCCIQEVLMWNSVLMGQEYGGRSLSLPYKSVVWFSQAFQCIKKPKVYSEVVVIHPKDQKGTGQRHQHMPRPRGTNTE